MNYEQPEEENRTSISLINNELLIYNNLKTEFDNANDTFIVKRKFKVTRSAKKYSFYIQVTNLASFFFYIVYSIFFEVYYIFLWFIMKNNIISRKNVVNPICTFNFIGKISGLLKCGRESSSYAERSGCPSEVAIVETIEKKQRYRDDRLKIE